MKNELPPCPFLEDDSEDKTSEEAWLDGLDLLMEELKFEEELPFKVPDEIWEEIGYILDEEDLQLSAQQKETLRKLFDQLWPNYKDK